MKRYPRGLDKTEVVGCGTCTWPGVQARSDSFLPVLAKRTLRGRWPPGRTRLCRVAMACAASGTEPI